MNILVGCEKSGIVRDALTRLGHYAVSADTQEQETPGNHYKGDVREILHLGWDAAIFFPPCTYLTYSGNRHWHSPGRQELRQAATDFALELYNSGIPRIAIENPLGHLCNVIGKPQVVYPWWFGDQQLKRICLWTKGLPLLQHNNGKGYVKPAPSSYNKKGEPTYYVHSMKKKCSNARSRFFPHLADAFAKQWFPKP